MAPEFIAHADYTAAAAGRKDPCTLGLDGRYWAHSLASLEGSEREFWPLHARRSCNSQPHAMQRPFVVSCFGSYRHGTSEHACCRPFTIAICGRSIVPLPCFDVKLK